MTAPSRRHGPSEPCWIHHVHPELVTELLCAWDLIQRTCRRGATDDELARRTRHAPQDITTIRIARNHCAHPHSIRHFPESKIRTALTLALDVLDTL
ncbi:hypothetical protein K353_04157 [Kitasatospora sp. SolWspMP-SS2h]|uniref:hypothetical protein n=1 Tax=Kitasatospora sp. SolWspMP-SS2h TaxID=1305729 RepID=UPI000DBA628F|nr:hypothetical protein [Kitasatospora sp. SolWspMP-SS2h]RAJ38606.1 hypothetical protein K353_04157 [Kitasatospora sp. SolWspMP-SS2h]